MSIFTKTLPLNTGAEIPVLGFGTWQIKADIAARCVSDALEVGYRHIDTAAAYGNEKGVGEGIRASGLARSDVFVTTKVFAEYKTAELAKRCIESSLANLDLGYVDLLLIHAAKPWEELHDPKAKSYFEENLEVWRVMEGYVKSGDVKAIGVSNFKIPDLKNIIDHAEIQPAANQISVFIGKNEAEMRKFCGERGIIVEAYSPNITGHLKDIGAAVKMAEKYGVSVPQLGIKYDLQIGTVPLPKTTHKEFMIENSSLDFVISDEDMAVLDKVIF
ncbi:MAG: aldo/keto reductase [Clostridia bacterium]|nr:aldo/keto reductase [Clostridia bacterium]